MIENYYSGCFINAFCSNNFALQIKVKWVHKEFLSSTGGRYSDIPEVALEHTLQFFSGKSGIEVRSTDINNAYDPQQEVANYVWADLVIYHTPIWWFQLPHKFKEYIDIVFTEGHRNGIYQSDGRSSANPAVNYGTGGSLQGKKYLLTTSWNAPATAFTLPGEFFKEKSVDDGPLFGFHRMNAFTGMEALESIHFHDVEKNADVTADMLRYQAHLDKLFLRLQTFPSADT